MPQIDSTIDTRITGQLQLHLGVNKKLTSNEINDMKNKLGYVYSNCLKKKNQILILQTHIDSKTTPEKLNHIHFPAPFIMFENDHIFVKNYNDIIEKAQHDIMNLEIKYFKEQIEILENDINVCKDILSYHISDIATLSKEIFDYQQNVLKTYFETTSIKASKVTSKPFKVNPSGTKNKQKNKSSKQFRNEEKFHHILIANYLNNIGKIIAMLTTNQFKIQMSTTSLFVISKKTIGETKN